jgi:hypothetical protein
MSRQMCVDCPHRVGSRTHGYLQSWLKDLEESQGGHRIQPFGCHMIADTAYPIAGEECVGDLAHLEKLGRLAPLGQEAQCPTERSTTP